MKFKIIPSPHRPSRGKFPSLKNASSVKCASALEMDMVYLLELDPDVISYKTQPFKLHYLLDKKLHVYTPDILVTRTDRKQIVEVKWSERAETEKYILLFKTVAPLFESKGCEYIVATEKTIRIEPKLYNIKLLYKYSRTPISYNDQTALYRFFRDRKEATFGEIESLFASHSRQKQLVYALVCWGVLALDINQNITPDTIVRLSVTDDVKGALA